jgi:hypothetical protein
MKPSKTIEDSLGTLQRVNTTGDVRNLIATAMLAKLRGELSDEAMLAVAKGGDALANMLGAEVKVVRAQIELREKGGQLGSVAHLGQMLIGNSEAPQT